LRENNTYLDCPIADHAQDAKLNMIVGAYNPSALLTNIVSVAVPHGNLKIQKFNSNPDQMVFENANAVVLCDNEN